MTDVGDDQLVVAPPHEKATSLNCPVKKGIQTGELVKVSLVVPLLNTTFEFVIV